MLEKLQKFVDEMKSTSSLNEKKVIIDSIKNNEFITSSLNYTYDPYKKYYVTSKTCKKNSGLFKYNLYNDLFNLLDDLSNRVITGHDSIAAVNGFITTNPKYEDLIFSIIDRNLEIRASDSVINKVIPNLIPTFDVALATKYEPKFCDFENEVWLGSRKLDGVRCLIRKEGNKVTAYSRQGNEFTTLQKVIDDVSMMPNDFVLDGEICLMDENDNEDFQGIMKQIKRKDHTIKNPKYIIFDYLTLEEFDTKESNTKLSDRLIRLPLHQYDTLSILEQINIDNEQQLSEMIADADANGYEGVMLRKDVGYEGKRSKNLLKCKKFFDAEYKVLDWASRAGTWDMSLKSGVITSNHLPLNACQRLARACVCHVQLATRTATIPVRRGTLRSWTSGCRIPLHRSTQPYTTARMRELFTTCYPLTPWSLGEQGKKAAGDSFKRRDCPTYRVGRPLDRQSLGLLSAGRMCHV